MKKQITITLILFFTILTNAVLSQIPNKDIKVLSPRESYHTGQLLADSSRYSKALPYFEKAYVGFEIDSINQRAKSLVSILICYESLRMTKEMESRLPEFQAIIDQLPAYDINKGLYYKSIKNHYYDIRQYQKSIQYTDLLLENLELQENKDWELIFDAKRIKSVCYCYMRNFEKALEVSEECNKIAVQNLSENKKIQMNNLSNRGLIAGMSGDYKNSLAHYLAAEKVSSELPDSILQEVGLSAIHMGIANNYGYTSDFHKALPYFYKSYQGAKKKREAQGMVTGLINIGKCQNLIGNIDESALAYKEARELIASIYGEKSYYMNMVNDSYARVLVKKKDFHTALDLYDQVLAFHSKKTADDILTSAKIHEDIARIYFYDLKDFKNTNLHLDKAFNLISQLEKQDRYSQILLIRIYHLKAFVAALGREKPDFDESLEYSRKALSLNLMNPDYQLGDTINTEHLLDYRQLFHSLKAVNMAYLNKYKKEQDKTFLEAASFHSMKLDQILDSLFIGDYSPNSIKQFRNANTMAYDGGIFAELLLHEDNNRIDKAFYLAEKSKSLYLLQGVREEKIKRLSGIPEDIASKEKNYKERIQKMRIDIDKVMDKKGNTLDSLQKEMSRLIINQGELVGNIKNDFPNYYKMKYDYQLTNIEEIQSSILDNKTVIIQYAFSSDFLNAIIIQNDKKDFIAKTTSSNIIDLLDDYIVALKHPTKKGEKNISLMSQDLYEYFIAPILDKVSNDVENIIIIPTYTLNHLPFETLQDSTGKYLIQDYNISYAYSSTSLLEQINKPNSKNKRGFGGFAAEYDQDFTGLDTLTNSLLSELIRNGNYNLPGAVAEVENISQLLSGDQFIGKEASVSNFMEISNRYKVLHLAMHSNLNENAPLLSSLLFSKLDDGENELTAIDLYSLRLDADLVVLSACNTGSGQLKTGEGVMSLSRAFSYAGVPSTVMSLWKVPDASTSKIMVSFYQHLKEGKPKDEALRLAKLDYLNNLDTPEAAHPYYWAGFILSGDTEPIADSFSTGTPWVFYLVISAMFMAFAYLFLIRKKK